MLVRFAAMGLEQDGLSSSTGPHLLDQPFILTNVWSFLDAADKKALRQGCTALRLAVDEQVASLALLDNKHILQPAESSVFEAAGQRWPNTKRIALTCAADVQTLLSPGNYGGHAPFPRLQALTVKLVGAWLRSCTWPLMTCHSPLGVLPWAEADACRA